MSGYSIEDLKSTSAPMFRAIPTGDFTTNRNGRRVPITKGVTFIRTRVGEMEEDDWYQAMEEAVEREGKSDLLDEVIIHCRKLAWLKKEEQVRRYALDCISNGAYLHWPEWKGESE